MGKYQINIYWSKEDDCFVSVVPELKYLMAHGDTQEQALFEAQEAIKLWCEVAKADLININGSLHFSESPKALHRQELLEAFENVKQIRTGQISKPSFTDFIKEL